VSDEHALLAAIAAHPDEDTPRLAYADWLDEHATSDAQRARAEFIRVQCEQARLEGLSTGAGDRPPDDTLLPGLRRRGDRLLERYRTVWESPLRGPLGPYRDTLQPILFRRGFPYFLSIPVPKLLEVSEQFFQQVPITDLSLDVTEETLVLLIGMPRIARFKRLRLNSAPAFRTTPVEWSRLAPVEWSRLADATEALQTSGLSLQYGRVSDGGKLANANWTALSALTLWNVEGRESIERALSGSWAKRLTELTVYNSPGVDAQVISTLPQLRRLTMNRAREEAISALVRGRFWPQLTHLQLHTLNAGDHAVGPLASAKAGSLLLLSLAYGGITAAGASVIVQSRAIETVRTLALNDNPIGDVGAHHLAGARNLAQVVELNLANCGIGPVGVTALASSSHFPGLKRLILDANPIAVEGAAAIAESPYLRGLAHLSIRRIGGAARSRLRERFGDRLSAS